MFERQSRWNLITDWIWLIKETEVKIDSMGTSPVVQCLRLPMQGAQGQSLVRELDPTCRN